MDFIFDCGFDECIPKNNEDSNVDEKGGARSLAKYLQMVENFLQPYLAYSGHGYRLYRCVFHPPDNHPSLLLNLRKGYVHDFHTNESYSLKSFLQKIGALTSEKIEKSQEPVKIEKLVNVLKSAGAIEYYSKPLIPKSALLLLCGFAGAGKSMLTLDIALKLAEGKSVWGCFNSTQTNVLLIDLENPLTLIKERCQFLGDSGIPENIYFYSGEFFLDRKDDVEKLEKIITDNKISLIIIDNLSCLFKNTKENDNLRIYLLLKRLRDICLKHGATCIIIHHLRKQMFVSANPLDEIRGSSTIAGIADMVLYLQKVQDFFQLKIVKNRLANVFDSYLVELDVGGFKLLQKDMQGLAGDRLSAVIRHIEAFASQKPEGVFTPKELKEAGPFTEREIFQGIQFLLAVQKVRKIKRGLYQYQIQTTLPEDVDTAE
jgi:archaellum biogenesis ATPase FlaH